MAAIESLAVAKIASVALVYSSENSVASGESEPPDLQAPACPS